MPNSLRQAGVKGLERTSQFDFVNALSEIRARGEAARIGWSGNVRWIAFLPADRWAVRSRPPSDKGLVGSRYLT